MECTTEQAAQLIEGIAVSITDPVDDATMLLAGQTAVAMIVMRTKRGIDADYNIFKPYSDKYAMRKINAGHAPFPVSLTWTGHMLGAMAAEVIDPGSVTLRFLTPAEAAKAEWMHGGTHNRHGQRVNPPRQFFDIRTQSELDVIAEIVGEGIETTIARRMTAHWAAPGAP